MFALTIVLLISPSFGKQTVKEAFEKAKIVPYVIDKSPENKAEVKFKTGVEADLGNNLNPKQVNEQPTVTWNAKSSSIYTVAMVDPDAPTPQNNSESEIRHWLVVNIPDGNVDKGKVITKYLGSKPPKGSDPHRYIILVYKQDHLLKLDSDNGSRAKFSIRYFATINGLGYPVAGNLFRASYDGSY